MQHLSARLRSLSAALKERDEYTAEHDDRTRSFVMEFGRCLKLETRELEFLGIVASVHDVGKIGVPDRVLLKPGRLDAEEWAVMQTHSDCGYRILKTVETDCASAVAVAVRHHHEAYDGSGYPAGLAGDDIPLLSRIVALADSYDAMATTRSYRSSKPHEAIMRIMHEESGGKFDPYLFGKFTECIERSPLRARH